MPPLTIDDRRICSLAAILSSREALDNVKTPQFIHVLFCITLFVGCSSLTGCRLLSRKYVGPNQDGSVVAMPNPLVVPVTDSDFTWHQVVDMVDDYFDIASEQPVREIGGVLIEGRIITQPKTGATCLEFLLPDSTPGFERWHSTLQSVRRTANVRVLPGAAGFEVYVEVFKELEDVSQPAYSTVSSSARRRFRMAAGRSSP